MRKSPFPAFPVVFDEPGNSYSGMDLLDYFAGRALQGMLAHSTRYRPLPGASENWHEAISEEAYGIADAMLAERERRMKEVGG